MLIRYLGTATILQLNPPGLANDGAKQLRSGFGGNLL